MFPLFWLLRNLGGLARWVGPGRRPGKSGGGRAWGGGRGRGQSQAAPTAPTEPEIPAERRRERQRRRDTHRERQRATHSQKEWGAHTLGYGTPAPPRTGSGPESVNRAHPRSLLRPVSVFSRFYVRRLPHSRLTWPFSLQSSRRGFWTDARPQDRILRWWKVGGTA